MSLLNKFREGQSNRSTGRDTNAPLHAPSPSSKGAAVRDAGRFSNGLKQFLWHLSDLGSGRLLDLGQVSQATLNFFIERGFKVYTEDLLTCWGAFTKAEEEQAKQASASGAKPLDPSPAARAERFLTANLHHAPDTFDAVILWDFLDYIDHDVAIHIAARLGTLVLENGAIFAIFHAKTPADFQRYRVIDANNLELVPVNSPLQPQHIYQNREIQNLFENFRSCKTFVGRDQLREGVFVK
jgi:hypothetical protein